MLPHTITYVLRVIWGGKGDKEEDAGPSHGTGSTSARPRSRAVSGKERPGEANTEESPHGIHPPLTEALLLLETGAALQRGGNYLEKTNIWEGEESRWWGGA